MRPVPDTNPSRPKVRYVVAGDPAEGNPNSDDSACHVLRVDNGEAASLSPRALCTNSSPTSPTSARSAISTKSTPANTSPSSIMISGTKSSICSATMAGRTASRHQSDALLKGLLFCRLCRHAMTPAHSVVRGKKYRYYICTTRQKLGRIPPPVHNSSIKDGIPGLSHFAVSVWRTLSLVC